MATAVRVRRKPRCRALWHGVTRHRALPGEDVTMMRNLCDYLLLEALFRVWYAVPVV